MNRIAIVTVLIIASGCSKEQVVSNKTEHLEASLISEVSHIKPDAPFWVALRLKMEEGWHVNWKNPGDAGLAPTIKWELPVGFKAGEIEWLVPHRLSVPPFVLFGYENEILLPVQITPSNNIKNGEKIILKADCDWVVCGDVCLPGSANLSLELSVKDDDLRSDPNWSEAFSKARAISPIDNELFFLTYSYDENTILINFVNAPDEQLIIDSAYFFPEKQGLISNIAGQTFNSTNTGYRLEIERDKMGQNPTDALHGIMLVYSSSWKPASKGLKAEIPPLKSTGL